MRKIHECAEDIKNILNDAERTEEVDGDMLCSCLLYTSDAADE